MSTLAYRIITLSVISNVVKLNFLYSEEKMLKYAFMQVFYDQVQKFC